MLSNPVPLVTVDLFPPKSPFNSMSAASHRVRGREEAALHEKRQKQDDFSLSCSHQMFRSDKGVVTGCERDCMTGPPMYTCVWRRSCRWRQCMEGNWISRFHQTVCPNTRLNLNLPQRDSKGQLSLPFHTQTHTQAFSAAFISDNQIRHSVLCGDCRDEQQSKGRALDDVPRHGGVLTYSESQSQSVQE